MFSHLQRRGLPLGSPFLTFKHALASRPCRQGRPSGGVSSCYIQTLGDVNVLIAEENVVVLAGHKLNIVACYAQATSANKVAVMVDKISLCFAALGNNLPLLLAGDFNTRLDRPLEM